MSSNIRINKVCKHCNRFFIAKTTVTSFCSDQCAKNNYKKRQRENKISLSEGDNNRRLAEVQSAGSAGPLSAIPTEMVSINRLSEITGLSQRTIFRLLKDPGFPRLKIGKRLLFKKDAVIDYLTSKYGNHEGNTERKEIEGGSDQLVY
jgi:predicted DNA-binding transcriptional regulator AlpA